MPDRAAYIGPTVLLTLIQAMISWADRTSLADVLVDELPELRRRRKKRAARSRS